MSHERRPLDRQRPTGPGAAGGHRPSASSSRRAAPRRADVDHGRRRGRDAGDHADRRSSRSAGATRAGCRARAGAERRPRPRLSGPPASARGAGDCEKRRWQPPAPSGSRRSTTTRQPPPAAGSDRRQSESVASTRASLPATSCSAGVPRANDRIRDGSGRWPPALPAQPGSPSPSVDEVADAVVRATARTAGAFGARCASSSGSGDTGSERATAAGSGAAAHTGLHTADQRSRAAAIACSKEPSSTPF